MLNATGCSLWGSSLQNLRAHEFSTLRLICSRPIRCGQVVRAGLLNLKSLLPIRNTSQRNERVMNTGRVLILFGPPGSGKGTQGERLASFLRVPTISTGEILRTECQSGSLLGRKLAATLSAGQLVSDELVSEAVGRRLQKADCASGCILDGYPRTIAQAESLDELLRKLGFSGPTVLDFLVPPRQIVARLERRRQCAHCGRIFSVVDHTGPLACETDGAPLLKRTDDHPAAIRERLRLYTQHARELVRYYRKASYHRIRADRSPDEVTTQIFSALNLNRRGDVIRPRQTLTPRAAY